MTDIKLSSGDMRVISDDYVVQHDGLDRNVSDVRNEQTAHRRDSASSTSSHKSSLHVSARGRHERERFQRIFADPFTESPDNSGSESESFSWKHSRRTSSLGGRSALPTIRREYSIDGSDGYRTRRSSVVFKPLNTLERRTTTGSVDRRDSSGAPAAALEGSLALPELHITDAQRPFGDVIGAGSFGTIHRVPLKQGGECAIKQFRPQYQDQGWDEFDLHEDLRKLIGGHENIMQYLGSATIGEDDNIILAFEWIRGATVGRLFEDARARLSGEELLKLGQYVIAGAVKGLAALEGAGYAHNDVKPDNIFFDRETKTTKLIDLGNASVHNRPRAAGNAIYSGPERVMALPMAKPPHVSGDEWVATMERVEQEYRALQLPEREKDVQKIRAAAAAAVAEQGLLSAPAEEWSTLRQDKQPLRREPVTRKTDAFGVGQVLHELIEGRTFLMVNPADFRGLSDLTFAINGAAGAFEKRGCVFLPSEQVDESKVKSGYYDFVNKAMHPDPAQRLASSELLAHPFLAQNLPSSAEIDTILRKL
jgi:serine/threonine protein kinase